MTPFACATFNSFDSITEASAADTVMGNLNKNVAAYCALLLEFPLVTTLVVT